MSICTKDTEMCKYAVLPAAREMHSNIPTGNMPRVHSKNDRSACAPS